VRTLGCAHCQFSHSALYRENSSSDQEPQQSVNIIMDDPPCQVSLIVLLKSSFFQVLQLVLAVFVTLVAVSLNVPAASV